MVDKVIPKPAPREKITPERAKALAHLDHNVVKSMLASIKEDNPALYSLLVAVPVDPPKPKKVTKKPRA